jgi:hypothetical protein
MFVFAEYYKKKSTLSLAIALLFKSLLVLFSWFAGQLMKKDGHPKHRL